jgi:hypothetical protein
MTTNGRLKKRRNVSADARAQTMMKRFSHSIDISRPTAIMHRRSLDHEYAPLAVKMTPMRRLLDWHPERRARRAGKNMDVRALCDPLPGSNTFICDANPGWSSLSLLDPGLISSIPPGSRVSYSLLLKAARLLAFCTELKKLCKYRDYPSP